MTEFASSSAARPIDRVAHDAQCSSRLLKEDVPGSRQLYSACCSLKQLYADLCFQLADHAGQRRLRDVKLHGGAPKAALLRNRHEVSEMPKFQSESSIKC